MRSYNSALSKLKKNNLFINNETISIKGVIDSTDALPGGGVLTDFKRRVGQNPVISKRSRHQLTLYGLASGFPLENLLLGNWSILEGQWTPRAGNKFIKHTGLLKRNTPIVKDEWSALRKEVQELRSKLINGAPFEPKESLACDYCDFSGVCRSKTS